MKKLLLLLSFFALFFLVVATPLTYAATKPATSSLLTKNETVNHDYLVAKDNVTISGTVNGDVYAAGGNLNIDGTINGDLLVAGGNITISGVVKNDVRVAGGDITFTNAKVGGNVTALGGQIDIDDTTSIAGSLTGTGGKYKVMGHIGKGVTLGAGQATFGNSIGGDVNAGVGQLSFLPKAQVSGNVNYWSDNEASFAGSASVSGTVKQYPPNNNHVNSRAITTGILGTIFFVKIADILVLLIVGLLLFALFPIYFKNASVYITTHFWMAALIGLIAIIITPIIIGLLFFTVIGIPLAIFLMVVYLFALWIARIFPILAIGQFVFTKSGRKTNPGWAYVVGLVIFIILELIPIVSTITDILVLLTGFGTLLSLKRNYYTNLRTKKLI